MYTMYTTVAWKCRALALLGVFALVACGDDGGGSGAQMDSLVGSSCNLAATSANGMNPVSSEGCPPSNQTSCGANGGTVTRVCYPLNASGPTLARSTAAVGAMGQWSQCCCMEQTANGPSLYCAAPGGGGGAGNGGSFCAGGVANGILESGEQCDGSVFGPSATCPNGGMALCTPQCTVDMSACGQASTGTAATSG